MVIARNGQPVAELVPCGIARKEPLAPTGDDWWQPWGDAEAEDWVEGRWKVLTDTHTLVWALSEPETLGAQARSAFAESPFTASVANLWELVLESHKPGTLIADPLPGGIKMSSGPQIPTLANCTAHIRALAGVPKLHKDPFYRILVAQALAEGFTLATKDPVLARYGAPVVWD